MVKKITFLLVLFTEITCIIACKSKVEDSTPKYTIVYDTNEHAIAPKSKIVKKGYKLIIEDLPILSEDGFNFIGWKINEEFITVGYKVNTDITLKAEWAEWEKVINPSFSVATGAVAKGTEIEITCTTEGAVIYYTIDGSTPTASSIKYTEKIVINNATTVKAIAVKSEMKDSNVVEVAYTIDDTPPKNITKLTAECTISQTVKLSWTNPTDADFAKVVITYDTNKSVTILKTTNPNNRISIKGLTNGIEYTFTVKTYDDVGNVSSGVSLTAIPCSPITYTAGTNGGLIGTSIQKQGDVVKEKWMNAMTGNIVIGTTEIAKTCEIVAVPTGTVATVTMTDNSSWNSYIQENANDDYKGVFLSGRNVILSPFVISQYEVTEQLYAEVMGETTITSIYPKTQIYWSEMCAFCNELTKKTFGETTDQCVYYNEDGLVYTFEDAKSFPNYRKVVVNNKSYDTINHRWIKTGYRLPTEAEWEFCARGGDPNAKDSFEKLIWNFAYAGVQTIYSRTSFLSQETDSSLNNYAWYRSNSDFNLNEVGLKNYNRLKLYDMSGNVSEYCFDCYEDNVTNSDSYYEDINGNIVNPFVEWSGTGYDDRVLRGGSWVDYAYKNSVSYRGKQTINSIRTFTGIRLVRSIQ